MTHKAKSHGQPRRLPYESHFPGSQPVRLSVLIPSESVPGVLSIDSTIFSKLPGITRSGISSLSLASGDPALCDTMTQSPAPSFSARKPVSIVPSFPMETRYPRLRSSRNTVFSMSPVCDTFSNEYFRFVTLFQTNNHRSMTLFPWKIGAFTALFRAKPGERLPEAP